MPLKQTTNGYNTLKRTEVKNQFYFYRNDGGMLRNVTEEEVLSLMAKFLLEEEGERKNYRFLYEISSDKKTMRITLVEKAEKIRNKPNVVSSEPDEPNVAKVGPNFLKRMDDLCKDFFGQT